MRICQVDGLDPCNCQYLQGCSPWAVLKCVERSCWQCWPRACSISLIGLSRASAPLLPRQEEVKGV